MKASLILPIDSSFPVELLNTIIEIHQKTNPNTEIIISCHGQISAEINAEIHTEINAKLICIPEQHTFSLSRTRNAGAKASNTDWLVFCDIDTLLRPILDDMIALQKPVVRGTTRQDVISLTSNDKGAYYKCANSPILINKRHFEHIGGYCEQYNGWGYEDSDFEHKQPPMIDYDSKSYHILEVHKLIANKNNWNHGSDQNRALFEQRLTIPPEERIKLDCRDYQK